SVLVEITTLPIQQVHSVAVVFTSLSEENLVTDSVWNPDWMTNLSCMGVDPEFPHELLQQFLSFASSMGIVTQKMTPSLSIPGRLRRMASRWPSDYFLFPKLKEHLSGTRLVIFRQ
ncbi:hypothetical protein AVEN_166734-1, partial [Araneus ventricosus]